MEPSQIFQYSVYSKIIHHISEYNIHPLYLMFFYLSYLFYNNFDELKKKYYLYDDSCNIVIGYRHRIDKFGLIIFCMKNTTKMRKLCNIHLRLPAM